MDEGVNFDGETFLLLISNMLKSDNFNQELFEKAYAAMEVGLPTCDRG